MNEETIIEKRPTFNGQEESKQSGNAWKYVTLGGVSGILMGAGTMYAGQAIAKEPEAVPVVDESQNVEAPEASETSHTLENGLKVAAVNDDQSFGEAFAAARAEVGPGGVFHWHGGIYNTYSTDEWNSMSVEQKHDFAQQVQPEIRPDELSTPTDTNPQVVVVHHVHHYEQAPAAPEVHQAADTVSDDVQIVDQQTAQNVEHDSDVHIVGYANVDGHLAVGLDTTGDGQADVAVIDMDNNRELSGPDVVVDREGNMATVDEINNYTDPYQSTATEDPSADAGVSDDFDAMMIDA